MSFDPFSFLQAGALRVIDMQAGDILFRQDDKTTGMYKVVAGCVTLTRTSLGGDPLTLHRAVSGGYFGEASIFSDVYHCDAICTKGGRVLKIAKTAVRDTFKANSEFGEAFNRLLAVQVQQYRAQIEILAIRSAKDRVFAAYQARLTAASIPELASRLNLSPEACYRALRVLCDEGRMRQIGRGVYVLG